MEIIKSENFNQNGLNTISLKSEIISPTGKTTPTEIISQLQESNFSLRPTFFENNDSCTLIQVEVKDPPIKFMEIDLWDFKIPNSEELINYVRGSGKVLFG